jgi:hypothetical protein
MRRHAIAVILLCLPATTLLAQHFLMIPLRTERRAVEAVYDEIAALDYEEGRAEYAQLPGTLKTDLWLLQFERYLAAHPELNADQRAAIFEAIGLLSSGVLDMDRKSADWDALVRQPLMRLDADAKAAFDPVTFKMLFQRLGLVALPLENPKLHTKTLVDCDCSSDSDWCCIYPTCPETCHSGLGYRCTFTPDGCGTFFAYPCSGLCA